MKDTLNKLRTIIYELTGVEKEKIVPGADIRSDLGMDSLDVVELTLALESEWDISIPDEAMDRLKTVQDLVTMLES